MKNTMIGLLAFASTSALAFGGGEMYALGGIASDDGDIGGQVTFGTQISQSNWYVETSILSVNVKDSLKHLDLDGNKVRTDYESDYLTVSLAPMYKHSFNESFSIYGKLGAAYVHSDLKTKFTEESGVSKYKSSDNEWGVTYGFGAEYKSPKAVFGNSKFVARAGLDWYDYGSGFGMQFGTGSTASLQGGFTF